MKNFKKLVLTGIAGLITATSFGQFTLTGEVRPRAEFRNGYKKPMDSSQTNAFFIDQRTRVNFGYKHADYEFFVALQDIRVWGATAQLNTSDAFLAVHEAWGKAYLNKDWGLKFGRQEIKYDDHRIFGNVGWAQQARSHDGVLLQYAKDDSKLDLGVIFNQSTAGLVGTDYTGPSSYRDMYYAWYNNKFGDKVEMSLLGMMLGRQVDHIDTAGNPYKTINYVATLGTHTKFNFDKLKINFNGFFQTGSDVNSYTDSDGVEGAMDYSAYLIGLDLNYAISKEFSAGLGYEAQSGQTRTDTTDGYNSVNHTFNPWFGTNHKFNGFMDYFYVGSGHGAAGLQDAYLRLKYKKGKWAFGLDAHMFLTGLGVEILDNDTYISEFNKKITAGDAAGAAALDPRDFTYDSGLGTELDFQINTQINKSVKLQAGFSYMMATETLYYLKGVQYYNIDGAGNMAERDVPANTWGYIMITFKPDFLKE